MASNHTQGDDNPPPLTPEGQNEPTETEEEEESEETDDAISDLNVITPRIEDPAPLSTGNEYRLSIETPNTLLVAEHHQHLSEILVAASEINPEPDKQTQPPESSPSDGDTPKNTLCKDSSGQDGPCPYDKIILGEVEKEQLKAAGFHLLKIGRELLEEMNFVESLLGKFGAQVFDGNQSRQSSRSSSDRKLSLTTNNLVEDAMKQAILSSMDAINTHAKRLSGIQQSTEEYKQSMKATQYGSAFETPQVSNKTSFHLLDNGKMTERLGVEETTDQDLKNRVTVLESKVEAYNTKIGGCSNQLTEMYTTIRESIEAISQEIKQVKETLARFSMLHGSFQSSVDEKIHNYEQQIMQLAQTVWNLQCETRAQMHFAKEQK